jgi:hypothetical protein
MSAWQQFEPLRRSWRPDRFRGSRDGTTGPVSGGGPGAGGADGVRTPARATASKSVPSQMRAAFAVGVITTVGRRGPRRSDRAITRLCTQRHHRGATVGRWQRSPERGRTFSDESARAVARRRVPEARGGRHPGALRHVAMHGRFSRRRLRRRAHFLRRAAARALARVLHLVERRLGASRRDHRRRLSSGVGVSRRPPAGRFRSRPGCR